MGVKVTARLPLLRRGRRTFAGKRFVASLLLLALYVQAIAFVPFRATERTTAPANPKTERRATSSTPATQVGDTITVFGPRRLERTAQLSRFTEQFNLPADAIAPFGVQVVNGNPDGSRRVLSALVRLNGSVLTDANQINVAVPSLTQTVQLVAANTLEVSFFGRPGSFLTITVTATRATSSTAPVINGFNPKQGPPGTQVTLTGTNLKVGNATPAVTFAGSNNARQQAQVISSTPTQVLATVPNGAQTSPIELTTANGLAQTSAPFTVQASQDFQLSAMPGTVSAVQRGTATQVVTITSSQADFSQLARLQITGLPAGVTGKFEPTQITVGAESTLTLNLTNVDLSPGALPFTVSATATIDGHDVERTFPSTLNVIAAGQTALTGRVLSTEQEPIIGATVSLDGHTATTDSAGVFLLSGVTAGQSRPVMVDGRTASAPNKTYPVIVEPASIIAGQVNTVPFTFYLPAIDIQFEKDVIPNQNTVVGNPRLPDLAMTIPAGANLRNLDGTPVTRVSISPVEPDRVPAPLPSNLSTNMVYTSQPGGAITMSNVAMPVVYPNLAGADPNTRIELYYFDHDTVTWRRYGFGRVSADGLRIVPETNPATGQPFGLPNFSWHFPNIGPFGNLGGCKGDCPKNRTNRVVDLSTGIKIEEATDVLFTGARGSLELTRTYTSDLAQTCDTCPFGRGATHNYSISLTGNFITGGAGRFRMPEEVTGHLFSHNQTRSAALGIPVFTSRAQTSQLGDEVRRISGSVLEYHRRDGSFMRFDASGRLTSMTDTNNNTITLSYTGNNLTSVTDAVGRALTFSHDSGGRITQVTDPLGRTWNYTYGTISGNATVLTQVKDPLQNVTTFSYQVGARLTAINDKRGNNAKRITYDSNGRVIEQKFADNGIERYAYTLSGNTVTSVTVTDSLGRVSTKRFNVNGYVIEETDALGQKSTFSRDMDNNLVTSMSGPCGCTEGLYEYDERGNITKSTDRLGGVVRMEYEPVFNKVTKLTDELGNVTTFTYDSRGNMISRTDALGRITSYAYDGFGELTSMTDPLGHMRTLEYDAQGNLTAVRDALNNRSTFEYDAVGRLTAVVDPLGRRATFAYDSLDRMTALTDTAGATTTLEYDPEGNLIRFVNALTQRWTSAYDSKNRLISTTDPLGRVMRWTYDKEDQLTARVSPSGRTMRYAYDPRGLLESMTTPLGFVTRYEYDSRNNLLALTDARGNITTFTYDELYRLNEQRDPLGQLTRYTYDAADNLTERVDRLGRHTVYAYDALNRPTQIQYADATVNYQYDPAYRLTRIDDTQSGSIVWAYDNADRLLSETTPQGVVAYTYNIANQRASMTAADRPPVNYTYDTAGRLSTIAQGNETFTYAYDTLSRVASLQRPNGVRTTYAYDNVYRLSRLSHINSQNQALEDFQYAYNADDEIESITSLASPQLLPAAKTAAPADAANRIPQFGTALYTHDNEGQTITRTDTPTVSNFTWDARGRLTRATLSTGQTVDYNYDTLGRRISRTGNGLLTNFIYDQDDVVIDRVADGSPVDYLNGIIVDDKLRQMSSTSAARRYFIKDHLGSTSAITDGTGNVVERLQYEAFGANTVNTSTRYGYSGREHDSSTGLIFYRARWYEPQQGRFITEDPAGFVDSSNLYAYVYNNPVNLLDPYGLASLEYDSKTGQLTIYDSAGNQVGQYPAGNNTTKNSRGPWKPSTYDYDYYKSHPESDANGPYGSNGIFIFDVEGCRGCGVHSGRANKGGPQAKTKGCIRTIDDATEAIKNLNKKDPLKTLTVK
jgi:RHS repeat-associated protein